MKRYAELIGNYKNLGIKSPRDNKLVIDADYRGPVIVALHNDSEETQYIHDGMRIAQLVVIPYIGVEFEETEDLDDTERGEGGFGSTGAR